CHAADVAVIQEIDRYLEVRVVERVIDPDNSSSILLRESTTKKRCGSVITTSRLVLPLSLAVNNTFIRGESFAVIMAVFKCMYGTADCATFPYTHSQTDLGVLNRTASGIERCSIKRSLNRATLDTARGSVAMAPSLQKEALILTTV